MEKRELERLEVEILSVDYYSPWHWLVPSYSVSLPTHNYHSFLRGRFRAASSSPPCLAPLAEMVPRSGRTRWYGGEKTRALALLVDQNL